ncbi:MAG: adenylosuccinate lyase [Thaumarchaeota archaeon]|nr:adenylosuccinate lyase [Nitrososphaerota archaeon]
MRREPVHPIDYRYGDPAVLELFTEREKYKTMIEVEKTVAEVQSNLGLIPKEAAEAISQFAKKEIDVEEIKKLEAETKHEVAALVSYIEKNCGDHGRFVHFGLTSNDVIDTSNAIIIQKAGKIILEHLLSLMKILAKRALENRSTICVARTHGIHAEPYVFGLKFSVWLWEVSRSYAKIKEALEDMRYGKISGAVGTYLIMGEKGIEVEKIALSKLGLKQPAVATQILSRDLYARLIVEIAILSAILDKIATEIRNLQRTEIDEVREKFATEQVGSSAMPHKRNPINCEKVSGIARVLRGLAISMLEDIVLWHERDLSNSSTERLVLPEVFGLLSEQLVTVKKVIKDLEINKERMITNLELTNGKIYSELLLTELVKRGMPRKNAHSLVSAVSDKVEESKTNFFELAKQYREISSLIKEEDLKNLFNQGAFLRVVEKIILRVIDESEKIVGQSLVN